MSTHKHIVGSFYQLFVAYLNLFIMLNYMLTVEQILILRH